jgi:hypothetical protein
VIRSKFSLVARSFGQMANSSAAVTRVATTDTQIG